MPRRFLFCVLVLILSVGAGAVIPDCIYPFQVMGGRAVELGQGVSPLTREFLEKQPRYLLDPNLPSHKFLSAHAVALGDKVPIVTADGEGIKTASDIGYENVMKLMTAMDKPGTYFFVGNGMQPFYQMSKTLFEGTAVSDQIQFLPLSSHAVRFPRPEPMQAYFTKIGIDLNSKGQIFLVDSLSPKRGTSQEHSVILLRQLVVQHLIGQGMVRSEAEAKVVVIGLPERENSTYNATATASTAEWQFSLNPSKTYFDPGVRPDLVMQAYYKPPRWNGDIPEAHSGKFITFGPQGNPMMGEDQLVEALKSDRHMYKTAKISDVDHISRLIARRQAYVDYYTALVAKGQSYRLRPEVAAAIKKQSDLMRGK